MQDDRRAAHIDTHTDDIRLVEWTGATAGVAVFNDWKSN